MFDFFRDNSQPNRQNNDDNSQENGRSNDSEPRILFANLRRRNGPILTTQGYKTFSITTFTAWTFIVFVLWVFRIEVAPSRDLIGLIAGSSVELAALALAVLGLLHELNKEDKWFKLGLLLAALIFVGVVLGGFYLSLTWQENYEEPQLIEIYFLFVLGFVAATQFEWKLVVKQALIRKVSKVIPTRFTVAMQQIKPAISFVLPFFFILIPGLNRVTAVILLFLGGILSLTVLMGITTALLFKKSEERVVEDPFISVLKARYESEIETIVRFGELKSITLNALKHLQEIAIKKVGSARPGAIPRATLVARLRKLDVKESETSLGQVIDFLIERGVICIQGHPETYWTVPGEREIKPSMDMLDEISIMNAPRYDGQTNSYQANYFFEDYYFTELRNEAAIQSKLPDFVVDQYVMPKLLGTLSDENHFRQIHLKNTSELLFVNVKKALYSQEYLTLSAFQKETAMLSRLIDWIEVTNRFYEVRSALSKDTNDTIDVRLKLTREQLAKIDPSLTYQKRMEFVEEILHSSFLEVIEKLYESKEINRIFGLFFKGHEDLAGELLKSLRGSSSVVDDRWDRVEATALQKDLSRIAEEAEHKRDVLRNEFNAFINAEMIFFSNGTKVNRFDIVVKHLDEILDIWRLS